MFWKQIWKQGLFVGCQFWFDFLHSLLADGLSHNYMDEADKP